MAKKTSPQKFADQANKAYQAGDFLPAAQAYAEAASLYAAEGDALMSAEMKNNQSVVLLRAGQAQAALDAARGTEKTFAAADDSRRRGMALANQASALQALKKFKEAIDLYKRSAQALEKAGEWDMRLDVMQLLSTLYLRRFKFYDAVITLQSGLAGVKNPTPRQRFMKKILFIRL
jgi:tetratricopeptide (TPR) repeat protein